MIKFEQVLPGIPGIKVLKSPFGDSWSGITLVTGSSGTGTYLIDSGANADVVNDCLVPALKEEKLELESISWLLNTHTHGDHIGGHFRIRELVPSIKIATYRGSVDKMRDPLKYNKLIRARFPEHSNPPALALKGVEPGRLVEDGELVGGRLRLIHAPGHDDDTVCWYDTETKTIITGDALQGNGTPTQGISFYMYLPEYRSTLAGLMKMDIDNLITGHQYVPIETVYKGADKVKECLKICADIANRNIRLVAEAMAAVGKGRDLIKGKEDEGDVAAVTREVLKLLGAKEPEYLFLAMYTVAAHMKEIAGGSKQV